MVTFRAGRLTLLTLLALLAGGCSREQQDWRSAEAADTREAYGRFVEQHPESELAAQARSRIEQLAEESDWAHATQAATPEAYREFLGQHPTGRWAEEARIRIEAFALGSAPHLAARAEQATAPGVTPAGTGVRALTMATSATPPPIRSAAPPSGLAQLVVAPQKTMRQATVASAIAATPAPASPVAAAGGAYGVQLGAFGSEASADREWHRLQGRFAQLGGLAPRIVAAGGAAGQLYRLQAPAAGEAAARALCATLRQQSQPCVPVLPQ